MFLNLHREEELQIAAIPQFPTGAIFIVFSLVCDLKKNKQAYLITTICMCTCVPLHQLLKKLMNILENGVNILISYN
jgi:uncharacterized membrane protein YpjA